MSDFVILTDSSADLTTDLVEELGVHVLPLGFTMQGKTYFNHPDNRDMDPRAFYDMLREGQSATTSAVNVGDYAAAIEPLLQQGLDVLVLAFSSGLSTTFNSGCIAAQELMEAYPQRKVLVCDTLCASLGQGLLVYLAAQKKKEGLDIQALYNWVEDNKLHVCHQFTVDDLHFLKRGGRVSATTAVVGSMLQIKPVLHVDDEGHLINIAKARGRHTSLKALVDKMAETITDPKEQTIFISHGDCLEDAEEVGKMARERLGVRDVKINFVGPVIGAHTGPGVVALFYVGSKR